MVEVKGGSEVAKFHWSYCAWRWAWKCGRGVEKAVVVIVPSWVTWGRSSSGRSGVALQHGLPQSGFAGKMNRSRERVVDKWQGDGHVETPTPMPTCGTRPATYTTGSTRAPHEEENSTQQERDRQQVRRHPPGRDRHKTKHDKKRPDKINLAIHISRAWNTPRSNKGFDPPTCKHTTLLRLLARHQTQAQLLQH